MQTYILHHRQLAFTLIELSIVLVIIGLVIGGVLVGQDLIGSAKNRAYVSQLVSYNSAVNTFKIKYNCLPGDCANATDYGFTGNGDGNGMVSGLSDYNFKSADYYPAYGVSSYIGWINLEANDFWSHLRSSLLIPQYDKTVGVADGVGESYFLPPAKNDGTFILLSAWNGKHYYRSGSIGTRGSGDVLWSLNFSPADAAYIFKKMGGTNITTTSNV